MTGELCAADAISQRVGRKRLAKRSQILISEPLSPCAVTGMERHRVLRVAGHRFQPQWRTLSRDIRAVVPSAICLPTCVSRFTSRPTGHFLPLTGTSPSRLFMWPLWERTKRRSETSSQSHTSTTLVRMRGVAAASSWAKTGAQRTPNRCGVASPWARSPSTCEDALTRVDELELFACWQGDQAARVEHRRNLTPTDLRRDDFCFLERELSVLRL